MFLQKLGVLQTYYKSMKSRLNELINSCLYKKEKMGGLEAHFMKGLFLSAVCWERWINGMPCRPFSGG